MFCNYYPFMIAELGSFIEIVFYRKVTSMTAEIRHITYHIFLPYSPILGGSYRFLPPIFIEEYALLMDLQKQDGDIRPILYRINTILSSSLNCVTKLRARSKNKALDVYASEQSEQGSP